MKNPILKEEIPILERIVEEYLNPDFCIKSTHSFSISDEIKNINFSSSELTFLLKFLIFHCRLMHPELRIKEQRKRVSAS